MPNSLLQESSGISRSLLDQIDATASDVMYPKKFMTSYGSISTGSFSFNGTASASNVISGKTFYSSNKTLQYGTMTRDTIVRKIGPVATDGYTEFTRGSSSCDLSQYLDYDVYSKLSADDIIIEPTIIYTHSSTTISNSRANINKSYDATTGKLTWKSGIRRDSSSGTVYSGAVSWYIYVIILNSMIEAEEKPLLGVYKIFSGTGNTTIDVKGKVPLQYQDLTEDNFIIAIKEGATSVYGETGYTVQGRCYPYTGSYNNSTGILTVTGTPTSMWRVGGGSATNMYSGSTTYEVYLTGGITDLT